MLTFRHNAGGSACHRNGDRDIARQCTTTEQLNSPSTQPQSQKEFHPEQLLANLATRAQRSKKAPPRRRGGHVCLVVVSTETPRSMRGVKSLSCPPRLAHPLINYLTCYSTLLRYIAAIRHNKAAFFILPSFHRTDEPIERHIHLFVLAVLYVGLAQRLSRFLVR